MNARWMFDARKIPDEVMNYLRRIAVRAIEEKGYSPELVADFLGIDERAFMTGSANIVMREKNHWIPAKPQEQSE